MKKTILTGALLAMAGVGLMAGSAMAVSTTWTDTKDWSPDEHISLFTNNPFSYYHDIADDGFDPWIAGGNDTISSFDLTVWIYDNQDRQKETAWVSILANPSLNKYDFNFASNTFGSTFLGTVDILHDGTLNVKIASSWGDFYLDKSELVVRGDNGQCAPVPEPATMLLFGTGLAGLIGAGLRRKK